MERVRLASLEAEREADVAAMKAELGPAVAALFGVVGSGRFARGLPLLVFWLLKANDAPFNAAAAFWLVGSMPASLLAHPCCSSLLERVISATAPRGKGR